MLPPPFYDSIEPYLDKDYFVKRTLYERFWFRTQFWLKPIDRRPYTYLIRDLYHKSPLVVITLGGVAIYLLGRYTGQISILVVLSIIVGVFAGMVLAHLFWGKKYIPNQQEYPTYSGGD